MNVIARSMVVALVNLAIIYVVVESVPSQDAKIIYGNGLLQNIDVTTQEEMDRLDPNDYSTHFVYNTRHCDYAPEETERLVFFFIVGNKGDVHQFQPIANSLFEYTRSVPKFKERHTCIDSYFFDLKSDATAFRADLIKKQADYVG